MKPTQGQQRLVLDQPLHGFTARKFHGLSQSGREVDVPLLAGLTFDELHFGGESHGLIALPGDI